MTKINQTNKQFTPNVKKLPLKEYYNSLPFAKKTCSSYFQTT